jgi:4-amino-4-deoxy-L-arabinose transferase-like glycosyltransferase
MPPAPAARRRPLLPAFCLFWLFVRFLYDGSRQLVPDEAYYWVWSRHLAAGFLDHPPMVALLIRASSAIFGETELGIRLGAAVLALGMILVIIELAKNICASEQGGHLAAWILLLSPMTTGLGTIVTPDTPACFFSACALACAVAVFPTSQESRPMWWIPFGLFLGLALLSKYTSVFLGLSILAALLSTNQGRRELLKPWSWLGALVALAVFMPNVIWNRDHNWACFRFQWHHGTQAADADAPSPIVDLGYFILGQIGLFTPILFVLMFAAGASTWRNWRNLPMRLRMILMSATVPLVFFALTSLRHKPEANWPIFAFLPATVLFVQWMTHSPHPLARRWMPTGIGVAAAVMIGAQIPEMIELVPTRMLSSIPNPWEQFFGWRQLGQELDELAVGGVVYCTSYENAAETSFYMAGHPDVWMIDSERPTAYDYFAGRPDPASLGFIVCVRNLRPKPGPEAPMIPEIKAAGFGKIEIVHWQSSALGRVARRREIIVAEKE